MNLNTCIQFSVILPVDVEDSAAQLGQRLSF